MKYGCELLTAPSDHRLRITLPPLGSVKIAATDFLLLALSNEQEVCATRDAIYFLCVLRPVKSFQRGAGHDGIYRSGKV